MEAIKNTFTQYEKTYGGYRKHIHDNTKNVLTYIPCSFTCQFLLENKIEKISDNRKLHMKFMYSLEGKMCDGYTKSAVHRS